MGVYRNITIKSRQINPCQHYTSKADTQMTLHNSATKHHHHHCHIITVATTKNPTYWGAGVIGEIKRRTLASHAPSAASPRPTGVRTHPLLSCLLTTSLVPVISRAHNGATSLPASSTSHLINAVTPSPESIPTIHVPSRNAATSLSASILLHPIITVTPLKSLYSMPKSSHIPDLTTVTNCNN